MTSQRRRTIELVLTLAGPLFLLALWLMKRIVESPLGRILQAIRENEVRAEAVGYHAPRFKLLAFVIGGAFSGLAGVLYAMLFGTGAKRIVGKTVFEQLGVGENHAELVVQPVEQTYHLGRQRSVLRSATRQRRVRRHG